MIHLLHLLVEEGGNISVYIDTSGSGGRGWVTHLLHRLVEEGANVQNVSRIYSLSFRFISIDIST